jgi:dienelactone hydrolase
VSDDKVQRSDFQIIMQRRMIRISRRHRYTPSLASVLFILVVAIGFAEDATAQSTVAAASRSVYSTPALAGPYGVGRRFLVWTDSSRSEFPDQRNRARRSLAVWIWYPADTKGREPSEALQAWWADTIYAVAGHDDAVWNPSQDTSLQIRYRYRRIHAVDDAAPIATPKRFPVALFLPGLSQLPTGYSYVIENLVSEGYVVIAVNPTGFIDLSVFPDGHVVRNIDIKERPEGFDVNRHPFWIADAQFALRQAIALNQSFGDPLSGRMDLNRLGAFGHSYGGGAAMDLCAVDAHVKACISLDGHPDSTLVVKRPGLHITAYSNYWERFPSEHQAFVKKNSLNNDSLFSRFVGRNRMVTQVRIRGATHGSFHDVAIFSDSVQFPDLNRQSDALEGVRGLRIIGRYVNAFFGLHLKGQTTEILSRPPKEYPEVTIVKGGK